MNANRRVAVNAIATYGRTLLRMGLGLFSSRWVLQSLGEVDYGLMGVVGSLIVFITFFNTVVTGACARFFAFSIGKNDSDDLIRWFNTGLSVHLSLAIILVAVGFPIGEWAIDNFLNIPSDRLDTAKWVFRFSLLAAFWTISTTPYNAMYTATQNIVELTFWEIASILTNFGFVYWLTTYKGNAWLLYAGFTVALSILLGVGQLIRAIHIFPGCKIQLNYWGDWHRMKEMLSFSGWSLFGSLGYMARAQFPPVLLNQFFSPIKYAYVNASYQIGGALASYTQSMSSSLLGAFTPHITTLAGANNQSEMIKASLRASKLGTFLILLFAIPLGIEVDHILVLWLGDPPLLAGMFCRVVLIQMILDNLTFGNMAGIMASGKIKWYQLTTGSLCILSIPIIWVVLHFGSGPISVSWVIAGCMGACSIARLVFGERILDIKINLWIRNTALPLLIVSTGAYLSGIIIVKLIPHPSIYRILCTGVVSCIVMLILAWRLLFDSGERGLIKNVFRRIFHKNRSNSYICP